MPSSRARLALLLLACVVSPLTAPLTAAAQSGPASATTVELRVDGQTVVTPRPVSRIDGEWLVPLAPIARVLGATLTLTSTRSLRVLRADGATVTFDSITGQIRQGLILLGETPHYREVQLDAGLDLLLFPLNGVITLLSVNARFDASLNALEIESPSRGGMGGLKPPSLQLVTQDYNYSLTANGDSHGEYLQLKGEEWARSLRVTHQVLLNRLPDRPEPQLTFGSVRMDAPARRSAITFGDQGVASGVDALGSTLRGIGIEQGWRGLTANAVAGRAVGSVIAALGSSGQANYDTDFASASLRLRTKRTEASLAGTYFDGTRSGRTVGMSYAATFAAQRVRGQALYGQFSGVGPRGVAVDGPAYGGAISHTFAPRKGLAIVSTSWERYGEAFLTSRDDARYNAVDRKALTGTIRPWSHVSVTGGASDDAALAGRRERARGYTYGASATGPLGFPLQLGYFQSVQGANGRWSGNLALTQYSLSLPQLRRYRASAAYSQFRLGDITSASIGADLSADFGRAGRIGGHSQFQRNTSNRYGVDWTMQVRSGDSMLRLGVDRLEQPGERPFYAPAATASLPLPWKQRLQLTYTSDRGFQLFQFQIGGPLLRRRNPVGTVANATLLPVTLSGQVYHDANLDGRYDGGADRRLSGVVVWLDDEHAVTTDGGGQFRFDGVSPGPHRLRADIAAVPASLIFRNGETLLISVLPYGTTRADFVAIPTGQISGRIIVTSITGTEPEPLAQPLADVRVMATRDRDTVSDGDGRFVLGDLPPGTYQLQLDPATLPSGYLVSPETQTLLVEPGKITRAVDFRVGRAIIRK